MQGGDIETKKKDKDSDIDMDNSDSTDLSDESSSKSSKESEFKSKNVHGKRAFKARIIKLKENMKCKRTADKADPTESTRIPKKKNPPPINKRAKGKFEHIH